MTVVAREPLEPPGSAVCRSSGDMNARYALPVEVAWSGTSRPNQFGAMICGGSTWSTYTSRNRLTTARFVASPVSRRETLEHRPRLADERIRLRARRDAQERVAEAVALADRIALDQPVRVERREQPPGGAAVQAAGRRELDDGGRLAAVGDRLDQHRRAVDRLDRPLTAGLRLGVVAVHQLRHRDTPPPRWMTTTPPTTSAIPAAVATEISSW